MTTDEKLDALLSRIDAIEGRMVTISANTQRLMDALANGPPTARAPSSAPAPTGGPCFPNYGRAKGQPIAGASSGDLAYYAAGARRSLDDPSKARWHDKERALLAAIEAEQARQTNAILDAPPFTADDEIPF